MNAANAIEDAKERIRKSILVFNNAVELTDNLEIIGTAYSVAEDGCVDVTRDEVFVLRDNSKPEGTYGAFVEVAISEIVAKAMAASKAREFIDVIESRRPSIVLRGVTRIVGYYSSVQNWNKSKVGELRDRACGSYGLTGKEPRFHNNRMAAIDSL
tara:strand:- start:9 stop:476 length:468 start_codon:yes stop_codon:yes gene_type:complete